MGTLHLVEGSSSLIALLIYNLFLTNVAYRSILYWTIALAFVAGLTVKWSRMRFDGGRLDAIDDDLDVR